MGLFNKCGLKGSASRLVLGLLLGTSILSLNSITLLHAANITYDGNNIDALFNEPTGNINDPSGSSSSVFGFKSLFIQNSFTGNSIQVVGALDGRAIWNTDASSTGLAPYIIYGGISIGQANLIGNGDNGQDIKNNIIDIKNVEYNWNESSNNIPSGRPGFAGGVIGIMGGAVYLEV